MIIIQDTREQQPWDFSFFPDTEVKVQGLKTGDYTMEHYQDVLCIERKRTPGEIAINLGKKWKAFSNELHRMDPIPFKYLICEFNEELLDIFPRESGIPEKHWKHLRMTAGFIKKRLYEETTKHNIELIFTSTKEEAERTAWQIFSDIKDMHE